MIRYLASHIFLAETSPHFLLRWCIRRSPPLTSPYWKSHLIPTKTVLQPLNQGHKSHLRAALWSAKQRLMEMIPQICFQSRFLPPLLSRPTTTSKLPLSANLKALSSVNMRTLSMDCSDLLEVIIGSSFLMLSNWLCPSSRVPGRRPSRSTPRSPATALWLISVLIQFLPTVKFQKYVNQAVHVFIAQTGTQRINLNTTDVWQLGFERCLIVDKIDGW